MYNKIILIGRVVNDPVLKYSQQGKAVTSFSLAVDKSQDETDFFDIVAFDKQAEVASKYLSKGRLIMVEGRLQTRTFETQEGTKRKVYEIIVDSFRMLDKRMDSDRKIDYDKKADYEKKFDFEKKHEERKPEKYEKKPYKSFDQFEEDEIIEEKTKFGSSKSKYDQPLTHKSKSKRIEEEEDFDDFFFDEN
ncbi:MAG: single-stranded DNA-binding protein [Candidatus Calescibacterium sp.]|nr:single-stranded DNA-binding protein [Candidatus Calescibacterium sp.]MDW8133283.1 single-stranded DNA-binding protein [Candidatus Calescibacterium sp.]